MNGRIAACWLLVGLVPGCHSLALPNIGYPGPERYQQARAEAFDPYPENEPGPAVEGGRPREYAKPPAEVDRARRNPHVLPAVQNPWTPLN